jgi:hypothetical protein
VASSGDIRAGRAAVELYVDQTELGKGLKQAEQSIKNVDKNVGAMRAGMLANQFAVGLQDFAVVYEQSKDLSRALSAAANNAIQLMTMVNPMAGAITAAAIAAYQLYSAFSKTAQAAKEQAKALKEAEETKRRMENVGEELQNKEYGPEDSRTLMDGIGTRSQARDRINELKKQWTEANDAKRARDEITRDLDIQLFETNDPLIRGKADASLKKGEALRIEMEKIDKQIADLEGRMGDLPFFSKDEMEGVGNAIADANAETEQANARAKEERDQEYERWREKRESERQSLTEQFETPAQRRERLGQKYKDLLAGPGASDESLETYNRAMASLDQKSTSVVGTFSGAALGGLSASSPLVAIQRATEETAKNTRKTSKGGTFT